MAETVYIEIENLCNRSSSTVHVKNMKELECVAKIFNSPILVKGRTSSKKQGTLEHYVIFDGVIYCWYEEINGG